VVAGKWRWALTLNPMTGIINGFRSALIGRAFDWSAISISTAIVVVTLICSAYAFRRMEKGFADLI
jgi:lipopolysaccharide transport system permease protein